MFPRQVELVCQVLRALNDSTDWVPRFTKNILFYQLLLMFPNISKRQNNSGGKTYP